MRCIAQVFAGCLFIFGIGNKIFGLVALAALAGAVREGEQGFFAQFFVALIAPLALEQAAIGTCQQFFKIFLLYVQPVFLLELSQKALFVYIRAGVFRYFLYQQWLHLLEAFKRDFFDKFDNVPAIDTVSGLRNTTFLLKGKSSLFKLSNVAAHIEGRQFAPLVFAARVFRKLRTEHFPVSTFEGLLVNLIGFLAMAHRVGSRFSFGSTHQDMCYFALSLGVASVIYLQNVVAEVCAKNFGNLAFGRAVSSLLEGVHHLQRGEVAQCAFVVGSGGVFGVFFGQEREIFPFEGFLANLLDALIGRQGVFGLSFG